MAEQKSNSRELRPLRKILPAAATRPLDPVEYPSRRVRKAVSTACDACRRHKSKCSGDRPACFRCSRQRLPCHYSAQPGETSSQALRRSYHRLRADATTSHDMLNLLRDLPDHEAQVLLQKIRSGVDVASLLRQVEAGDLLLQMALKPETRLRYDFPYGSRFSHEDFGGGPYLDSLVYETAWASAEEEDSSLPRGSSSSNRNGAAAISEELRDIYLKPFHAAQVIDPLLSSIAPSRWTTVSNDDKLMREMLSSFFRCEYQFTAAFQKNLFLEDMAACRQEFCSSLLVNIVLAYSCVCYYKLQHRAEYWNPHTLTYLFFAEARRLWELEAPKPHITTVQAGILFSVFYNLCGLDAVGQAYRIHSVALAHELRLFDSGAEKPWDGRKCRGWAFTAWTLYNWETLVAFSFMHTPLLVQLPCWPLPDPSKDKEWYGEVWFQYPLSQEMFPLHFGQVFKAKSEFRIIMNDFCASAYSKTSPGVSVEEAYELRSRLTGWYLSLAGPLQSRAIVHPSHLQLHIYFHHLLLSLYELLLDTPTSQRPPPRQIVAESMRQLKTLVCLYFVRHGFESMDLFIVIPLMLIAYDCIETIDDNTDAPRLESLRSMLLLAVQGLKNQRHNHYLAEALFRVICGRMRREEVSLLKFHTNILDDTDRGQNMTEAVRSHWPVSVVRKAEDLDAHNLTNLVQQYGHLNLDETDTPP